MRSLDIYNPIIIEKSTSSSKSLILPHQEKAVEALSEYFSLDSDRQGRHGLVVMPTGSGKTYTSVYWLLRHGVASGYRIVWLVHRQELVEQARLEFYNQAPLLKGTHVKKLRVLAVSSQHLHMSSVDQADVYVCSIASIANQYGSRYIERMLGAAGKRKVIVVIDEAHHAVAANYQKVLQRIKGLNPHMVLLGLTATPVRSSDYEQQLLMRLFHIDRNIDRKIGKHGYVYEVTLKQLLRSGFLATPHYEKVETNISGSIEYDITQEDRDFFAHFHEMSERIMDQIARSSARNKIILKRFSDNKDRYGKTLVFAVNQMHAETLCDTFRDAGISCDYAVSSRADSQDVIRDFKANKFQVLINVQMMTEGSDVPDIQTVFLTRETNSDSLLMQMIGRGLRGVKAGGTENAYIVAFHDTWDTFLRWMDPGELDILCDTIDTDAPDSNDDTYEPEIEPNMNDQGHEPAENMLIDNPEHPQQLLREIYFKLYNSIRASHESSDGTFTFPIGWYSLSDEEGEESSMLVFEGQQKAFEDINCNLSRIRNKISVQRLSEVYFDSMATIPPITELKWFLEYVNETGNLPPYYTFKDRDRLDPFDIAKKAIDLFPEEDDQVEYLKELFDKNLLLQQIYKYFYAFKKTVFNTLKPRQEACIVSNDDRENYEIISGCHDLNVLLEEVLHMFPKLSDQGLLRISWSKRVLKSWFALCRICASDSSTYVINVNLLLSSPQISPDVIKYLIFHELLHGNGYWSHDQEFRAREWQYPNSAELDGIIDSLRLQYKIEENYKSQIEKNTNSSKPQDDTRPAARQDESNVPERNTQDHRPSPQIIPGFKYCRECGNQLPQSAKYCDRCGMATAYCE